MSNSFGVKARASGEAVATEASLERKGSLGFRGGIGGAFALQPPVSALLEDGDEVEEEETAMWNRGQRVWKHRLPQAIASR